MDVTDIEMPLHLIDETTPACDVPVLAKEKRKLELLLYTLSRYITVKHITRFCLHLNSCMYHRSVRGPIYS